MGEEILVSQLNKLIRILVTGTGLRVEFTGVQVQGCVTAEIFSPVKGKIRDTAVMATADSAENALALAAAQGLGSIHSRIQLGFVSLAEVHPDETKKEKGEAG